MHLQRSGPEGLSVSVNVLQVTNRLLVKIFLSLDHHFFHTGKKGTKRTNAHDTYDFGIVLMSPGWNTIFGVAMDIHQAQKWARTGERQNINAIANGTVISKGRNRLKTPFCTARLTVRPMQGDKRDQGVTTWLPIGSTLCDWINPTGSIPKHLGNEFAVATRFRSQATLAHYLLPTSNSKQHPFVRRLFRLNGRSNSKQPPFVRRPFRLNSHHQIRSNPILSVGSLDWIDNKKLMNLTNAWKQ